MASSGEHNSLQTTEMAFDLPAVAVRRVIKKMRGQRQFMLGSAIFAVGWVAAAFFSNMFLGNLVWPMWVGVLLVFGWLAMYSKYMMPLRLTVTCPHCDELINLNKDWICGSCDDEKSPVAMQTYVRSSLPLEKCDECGVAANVIECQHCQYLVTADNSVNKSRQSIARFL